MTKYVIAWLVITLLALVFFGGITAAIVMKEGWCEAFTMWALVGGVLALGTGAGWAIDTIIDGRHER